jgi:predicted small lipoprotein YifL
VTIEGGPLEFPDPDTDAPIATGIFAPSVIEVHVA